MSDNNYLYNIIPQGEWAERKGLYKLSATAITILFHFFLISKRSAIVCFSSYRELASMLNICDKKIPKWLEELVNLGFIRKVYGRVGICYSISWKEECSKRFIGEGKSSPLDKEEIQYEKKSYIKEEDIEEISMDGD